MAEKVEELTCPVGHTVEVHYETGQKAARWQCPVCLERAVNDELSTVAGEGATAGVVGAAYQRAHEASLVSFRRPK